MIGTVVLGTAEELGTEEGSMGRVEIDEEDNLVCEVGGTVIVIVVEVVVVKLRVIGIAPLNGKTDVLEADAVGDKVFAWLSPEEVV